MKFDVFLPSLLVSPDWFTDSAPPRLPAIETLLSRGRSHVAEEWPTPLLKAFGAGTAVAAFSALGDELDSEAKGWMFAEPAHFQAGRYSVKLIPASQLQVSSSEAAQLIDALNVNFADRGLTFFCGGTGCWYVCCKADELPKTTPMRAARRGSVTDVLPESSGRLSWKAIQNEAQMLLHSHAVNGDREAAGKLPINGIWFWGEGVLPAMPNSAGKGICSVFGNTALASGLAKWRGAKVTGLPETHAAHAASLTNHQAMMIDSLTICHEQGDIGAWREAALKLDRQILAPLLASLRRGAIDDLVLTLPRDRDTLVVTLNTQSFGGIAGWWKNMTQKPRSIQDYFVA